MGTLKEGLESNKEKIQEVVKNGNDMVLKVPAIKKVEITAEQETIDRAVASARQYISEIPDHMRDLVSRIQAIRAASREERAVRSKELKQLEAEVAAHLNADNELLRNAAKKAYDIATIYVLADISVVEFFSQKPGKIFLVVSSDVNGKRFLPGGYLLAESNGKVVRALKAIGGFQKIMDEIIQSKVFVTIWSLSSRYFNTPVDMSDDKFRLMRILHAVLRRGIAEARAGMQKETV